MPCRLVLPLATALLLPAGACGGTAALSDAEKLARVQEMYAGYRASFAEVPEETVAALLAERDRVVLVDVRTPAERAVSMIPGAIPVEMLEAHPDAYRDRKVVTYCTIGYRSGLYAEKLRQRGWKVANLAGSILAWTLAHQPLVDARGPTRRVHVYGRRWNLAGEGYEAVW